MAQSDDFDFSIFGKSVENEMEKAQNEMIERIANNPDLFFQVLNKFLANNVARTDQVAKIVDRYRLRR